MRSINAIVLLLTVVLPAFKAQAQFPEFYTYLVKGTALLKKTGQKPELLKQKDLLYKGDVIEIKQEKNEVHFVDKNGHFIVIEKKGSYTTDELHKLLVRKNKGLTQKYFTLLWDDFIHPDLNTSHLTIENLTGAWGGTSRGDSCVLTIFPEQKEHISTDTLTFRWRPLASASGYSFTWMDDRRNELFQIITKDTSLTTVLAGLKREDSTAYFWSVTPLAKNCQAVSATIVYVLSRAEEERIVQSLLAAIKNEDTLLYNLQAADELNRKGFTMVAQQYLHKVLYP